MTGVTKYILDTNVISETRKIRADRHVMTFLKGMDQAALFMSVLTTGELRKGVEAKRRIDPDGAGQLASWVDGIETNFQGRILPIDSDIARRWGELSAGPARPVIDTLIAATAIRHGFVLVTRNIRDVASTGVRLIDPWQASPQ